VELAGDASRAEIVRAKSCENLLKKPGIMMILAQYRFSAMISVW
jgi:hypothetical protein